MKVLVIAPHADDEVLGCGGTIARHTAQRDHVIVLVMTHGVPELFPSEYMAQLHKEMHAAHQVLGVQHTSVLDFPAPALDSIPGYKIAAAIHKTIQEFQPAQVYIPHLGDLHSDHAQVYRAALVAMRPINGCSVQRILAYETLSETDWAIPSSESAFVPTVFVDITDYLEQKLHAMECYRSQLKAFPHTRSLESLKALARLRGGTVNREAAEAFMLVRQIE